MAEGSRAQRVEAYLLRRAGGDAEPESRFLAENPDCEQLLRERERWLHRVDDLLAMEPVRHESAGTIPRRFDGLSLRDELGRGGMGVVYEARDEELGRSVAIKFLVQAAAPGSKPAARFEREVTALAKLRHRNIVTVHRTGTVAERRYLVMDLIHGERLSRHFPERGEAVTREHVVRCLRWGRRLALALGHVHEAGVVHRDVKPDNVVIDAEGQPVLIDFGLARDSSEDALTRTGDVVGTPAYTAPEQALGHPVDHRADVYGLGATLHHLLLGSPPEHARGPAELARRFEAHSTSPPRSDARQGLPRDLVNVLRKAVALRPEDRYGSCQDLADELLRVLEERPVRARPVPGPVRWLRAVRRRPRAAAAWLAVAAALVLVTARAAEEWRRHRQAVEDHFQDRIDAALEEMAQGASDGARDTLADLHAERPSDADVAFLLVMNETTTGRQVSWTEGDPSIRRRVLALIDWLPDGVAADPAVRLIGALARHLEAGTLDGFDVEPWVREVPPDARRRVAWALYRSNLGRLAFEVLRPRAQSDDATYRDLLFFAMMGRREPSLETHAAAARAHALRSTPMTRRLEAFVRFQLTKDAATRARCLREVARSVREGGGAIAKADLAYMLAEAKPADWEGGWVRAADRLYRESIDEANLVASRSNLANLLFDHGDELGPSALGESLSLLRLVEPDYGSYPPYWFGRIRALTALERHREGLELLPRAAAYLGGPQAALFVEEAWKRGDMLPRDRPAADDQELCRTLLCIVELAENKEHLDELLQLVGHLFVDADASDRPSSSALERFGAPGDTEQWWRAHLLEVRPDLLRDALREGASERVIDLLERQGAFTPDWSSALDQDG